MNRFLLPYFCFLFRIESVFGYLIVLGEENFMGMFMIIVFNWMVYVIILVNGCQILLTLQKTKFSSVNERSFSLQHKLQHSYTHSYIHWG